MGEFGTGEGRGDRAGDAGGAGHRSEMTRPRRCSRPTIHNPRERRLLESRTMSEVRTTTLWRPTGPEELDLLPKADWRHHGVGYLTSSPG